MNEIKIITRYWEFVLKLLNTLVVSLRSPEWSKLSDRDKRDMDLTFEDDGEFW